MSTDIWKVNVTHVQYLLSKITAIGTAIIRLTVAIRPDETPKLMCPIQSNLAVPLITKHDGRQQGINFILVISIFKLNKMSNLVYKCFQFALI